MTTTELDIPHAPVTFMVSSIDPEEPDFESVCLVCWTTWPCLIAELADLPHARPRGLFTWDAVEWAGPHADEPPF